MAIKQSNGGGLDGKPGGLEKHTPVMQQYVCNLLLLGFNAVFFNLGYHWATLEWD
jgi:hypothetical protein